ncbi:MAG: rRNA maturation RNase YbeY [Candidatus Paracaedibacteraceae bacterium]|nr:rRNA maturation RNase YbeY [Candidatus Paracaedibacteraceae bacterium]
MPDRSSISITPVIIYGADQWKAVDVDWDSVLTEITHVVLSEFDFDRNVDVNIKLTNDAEIQILNREFRNKDKPTNVLSFPSMTEDDLDYLPDDAHFHLGDIALAYETIQHEANDQEKTLQNHVLHLTVHGLLHLLGFDHETDAEADEMETLEVDILAKQSIPNPYKE